jgi:cytochrome c-type biogenesis protein CcmH/NrfF
VRSASGVNGARKVGLGVGVGLLILVALGFGLLAARGPNPDAVPTPQQVFERTMSPFCTGQTLASCTSNQAVELRATIAQKISEGATNRQINAFLLANYSKTVIGTPRNPFAWLVPAAAVIAGLIVVAVVMRRRPPEGIEEESSLPAITATDQARLAADLRRFAEGVSE